MKLFEGAPILEGSGLLRGSILHVRAHAIQKACEKNGTLGEYMAASLLLGFLLRGFSRGFHHCFSFSKAVPVFSVEGFGERYPVLKAF